MRWSYRKGLWFRYSKAIERTKEKLACENLDKHVILILDGHENIDLYVKEEVDFVIYNLGYLPRGDKNIITKRNYFSKFRKSFRFIKRTWSFINNLLYRT